MSEKQNLQIIISVSPAKNIQEVVYHNVDAGGNKDSITRHEPLHSGEPVYRRKFAGRTIQ